MDDGAVAQVRRFNRTVTQRIGVLEDAFLARSRPLGHSRVLWEIGESGTDVRALRSRLDLDSGYLSRVLRALEAEELVAVEASPADGRVRVAHLTPAGARERAEVDTRSDEAAAAVLSGLGASQRGRLVTAMAEVERLLRASMVDVRPADPRDADARPASPRTSPSSPAGSTAASTPPAACPPPTRTWPRRPGCSCWHGCTASRWAAPP